MSNLRSTTNSFGAHHFDDASHPSNDASTTNTNTSPTSSYHNNQASSTSSNTIDTRIRSILDRNNNYHSHTHSSHPSSNHSLSNSLSSSNTIPTTSPGMRNDSTNYSSNSSITSRISFLLARHRVTTARTPSPTSSTSSATIYQSLQHHHEDSSRSSSTTNSTYASTDSANSPQLHHNDIPIQTFFFYSMPTTIQSHRPYSSYPEDDDWSQSSISDATHTTGDSTTSSHSAVSPDVAQPCHNPQFLGIMDYYFPPRLHPRPASTSVTDIVITPEEEHTLPDTVQPPVGTSNNVPTSVIPNMGITFPSSSPLNYSAPCRHPLPTINNNSTTADNNSFGENSSYASTIASHYSQ